MTDSGSTVDDMSEVRIRPLRRAEYDVLIEAGMFDEDERIQLLDGELVELSPQNVPHATVVERLTEVLMPALVGRARVRIQLPLAAGEYSEPEPDVAVVPADAPRDEHPDRVLLVIEVSDSTLRLDLIRKARIYAAAGFPEYWVIDVNTPQVHVFTQPSPQGYASAEVRGPDEELDACGVPLTLAQLLA
jgi:Uma2 family endonuclease